MPGPEAAEPNSLTEVVERNGLTKAVAEEMMAYGKKLYSAGAQLYGEILSAEDLRRIISERAGKQELIISAGKVAP